MSKSLCLFLVLTSLFSSIEFANAKIFARNPVELVHEKIDKLFKREILQKRQQSCQTILDDYPTMDCDITILVGDITNIIVNNASALTEEHFAALNNALSQVCVAKCVNPILNYYRCVNISDDLRNYLINYVQQGICGKNGNDFCEVLYIRRYSTNIRFINQLVNACPFTISGVNCSSADSTCRQYVSNFNTNMGCCTSPYLGNVSSCNVTVINPCESAVSRSIIVAPVIMCLFLAVLLTIFNTW